MSMVINKQASDADFNVEAWIHVLLMLWYLLPHDSSNI